MYSIHTQHTYIYISIRVHVQYIIQHIGSRTRSRVPPGIAYSVCVCVCHARFSIWCAKRTYVWASAKREPTRPEREARGVRALARARYTETGRVNKIQTYGSLHA